MSTRRLGLFAAWLVATSVAVLLASQAVGLVRDQVTDQPSRTVSTLLQTVDITATSSVPDVTEPTAPPASGPSTTTPLESTTTTTEGQSDTTTTTRPATTTTTTKPATTTTTNPQAVEFFTLQGGTVSVACDGDTITFRTASPKPGYQTDVEKTGPEKVEVKFKGSDHESVFKAQCHDGSVDADIDEHESGDD